MIEQEENKKKGIILQQVKSGVAGSIKQTTINKTPAAQSLAGRDNYEDNPSKDSEETHSQKNESNIKI